MNAEIFRIVAAGVVPFQKQLFLFRFSQKRQRRGSFARILRDSLKQKLEVSGHSLNSRRVKKIGLIFKDAADAGIRLTRFKCKIQGCNVVVELFRAD